LRYTQYLFTHTHTHTHSHTPTPHPHHTLPGKLCRPKIERRYKEQLNALYARGEADDIVTAVRELLANTTTTTREGGSDIEPVAAVDSMSAVRISEMLRTRFNMKVDAVTLLRDDTTLSQLAGQPTEPAAHPFENDFPLLSQYIVAPTGGTEMSNAVKAKLWEGSWLVTGASGFLGSHIVDCVMRTKIATRGGVGGEGPMLFCLVHLSKEDGEEEKGAANVPVHFSN
jgi:hypothetical protein